MNTTINCEEIILIIEGIGSEIEKSVEYLTELDQAIGDGDHGINLTKGFRAIRDNVSMLRQKDAGEMLKIVGQMIISNVGGAVGPLFGMAFMRAGDAAKGRNEIDVSILADMFEAGEKGIVDIGQASLGDKTMLDAIDPAVLAIKKAKEENKTLIEAMEMSVAAALEGVKNTKLMVPKCGRSVYLGERAVGHQDVGATSAYIIMKSALDTLKKLSASSDKPEQEINNDSCKK